jgi:hypothetical protein
MEHTLEQGTLRGKMLVAGTGIHTTISMATEEPIMMISILILLVCVTFVWSVPNAFSFSLVDISTCAMSATSDCLPGTAQSVGRE